MNKIFLTSEQTIELIEEKTKALVSNAYDESHIEVIKEKLKYVTDNHASFKVQMILKDIVTILEQLVKNK